MSEWPMVKLGEVCKINPRRDKSITSSTEISFIEMKSLLENGNVHPVTVPAEKYLKGYTPFQKHDILIAKITPCFQNGKIGLANIDTDFGFGTTEFHVVRSGETLSPEYLTFFLRQQWILDAGEKCMTGSGGQRRVPKAFLENLKLPLPPLGEQKRIAEILGEASKTIKDTEKIIHNVQGVKRSALRGILDNKSGEYVQLSQISSVQSGITKGRKVQNGITLMPTPYMAVSNVKAGYLALSEVKQIDASEAEVNRYQLQAGDILLTEGGDPDKLGRGTIWRNEIPGAIHQNHIFRVRINPDSGFTSEALMAILESTESKGYFLRSAKQTTGISSINKRQLSATPIPVLGKVQIEELTNMWHKIDEVIELYHRKLSLLQELQKSLANRAFAGLL